MEKNKTILIVEDVSDICDLYKALIEKNFEGCKVVTYTNAEEGLKSIYRNGFDIAIIDLKLNDKDLDGTKLVRTCVSLGKPVIICTGTGFINKLDFYLENGSMKNVKYIQKTLKLDKLIDAVKDFLHKEKIDFLMAH